MRRIKKRIRSSKRAIASGTLPNGCACHVLADRTRVLEEDGVVEMLAGEPREGGLEALFASFPEHIQRMARHATLRFMLPGGRPARGVDAIKLADLCSAFALGDMQCRTAHQAEVGRNAEDVFAAAFVKGVNALVDETAC